MADDIGAAAFKPVTIASGVALSGAINEVQNAFNNASSGTFRFRFRGQETADIAYNASAATVETALELLTALVNVTVTGVGTSGDPWVITFVDPGSEDVGLLGAVDTGLAGGVTTITQTTRGEPVGLDVLGWEIVSIEQPASCEGTAFTFQGSLDGTNFFDIHDDSAEISVTKSATAAQVLYLPGDKRLRGFSKIRVRSGTSASPTNQVTTAAALKIGVVSIR